SMNDDKTDSVINIELPERFARHGSLGLLSRAIFVLVGFVALFVLFFPFYLSIVLNLIYGDYKLSDHVLGKNDSSFVVPVWHTGLTVDSRIHQVAEPLDRESAEKLLPDTSMSRQVVLNDVLTT